ncbi:unnamed protein product [Absidia cylindrospora]
MIAGITVGIVLVPQSMAYAKIAGLEPQYGLYSSFVGVSIYCLFGTSKDISIGMISTVSLLVGQAIADVQAIYPEISGPQVAVTLSLVAGLITLVIGISRLGILVDFIPQPAIAGYMTGSAISITLGQWPKLFGLSQVDTHNPAYMIFVDFFKNLPFTKLDVAFGLTGLVALYLVRFGCQYLSSRKGLPGRLQKGVFYFGIMRNGLVVIVGTLISFGINRQSETSLISIIKDVPAGFDALAVPMLDSRILAASSAVLPSIIIIMILEHVSVAKSFGRVYDYNINPNQEIFAIGISNILGSFFGGAPATGAFSRTAIMAKSGVRTPAGGIFSSMVVLLALYLLTPCFYYIPDAILSAVVIHAVADLVSSPRYLKELFDTSLAEFLVWLSGVVVTICVDVQSGIYAAVGLSLINMLFRSARPPIKLLARLPLSSVSSHHHQQSQDQDDESQILLDGKQQHSQRQRYVYVDEQDLDYDQQYDPLPPGLLIVQLAESILYPNAEFISETILKNVKSRTRCGNLAELEKASHQLTWNHPVSKSPETHRLQLPVLRVLVLDFTAVRRLDCTALHTLVDLRNNIDKYSGQIVEWHFVGIRHLKLRRDLIYYGFGLEYSDEQQSDNIEKSSEDDNIIVDEKQPRQSQQSHQLQTQQQPQSQEVMALDEDLEIGIAQNHQHNDSQEKKPQPCLNQHNPQTLLHDKYPYFHWDMDTAMNSILETLELI